jgi:DNA-binding NtrC family response regulator
LHTVSGVFNSVREGTVGTDLVEPIPMPEPPLFDGHPRMRAIRSIIESIADTDTTVLIRGESGVGK